MLVGDGARGVLVEDGVAVPFGLREELERAGDGDGAGWARGGVESSGRVVGERGAEGGRVLGDDAHVGKVNIDNEWLAL